MIIFKGTKHFQTRSDKPNENWTNEDVYVLDDNSELAKNIQSNYPFFELVIKDEEIIDIELWSDKEIEQYKKKQKESEPLTDQEIMAQELSEREINEMIQGMEISDHEIRLLELEARLND